MVGRRFSVSEERMHITKGKLELVLDYLWHVNGMIASNCMQLVAVRAQPTYDSLENERSQTSRQINLHPSPINIPLLSIR